MAEQYFSFFGSVQALENKAFEAAFKALVNVELDRIGEEDEESSDYQKDLFRAKLGALGEIVLANNLEPVELGSDASTYATAYPLGDGTALLIVQNNWAKWIESGLVKWPLVFTGPAAIAGANCASRYGLER